MQLFPMKESDMKEKSKGSEVSFSRRDLFKTAAIGAGAYMVGKGLSPEPAEAAMKEGKWVASG